MKPLRFAALLPAVIALPSLLQNMLPAKPLPAELLMSPSTALGLIIISIVWFLYFSEYRYSKTILAVQGIISLPLTSLIIASYLFSFKIPFEHIILPPNSTPFMLNLAIAFTATYLIQILYRWLPRTTLYINGLLAIILFIAVLSISGHLYNLDKIVSAQLLMPIPPTAILGFVILSLTIFVHINRMERLYLNRKILVSFLLMLVAIMGANVVVYKNFNQTVSISNRIDAANHTLAKIYNIDLLLDGAESDTQAYELSGNQQYITAYAKDKQVYLNTIKQIQAQPLNNAENKEVQQSIHAVAALGKQILVTTDALIAQKQHNTLRASTQTHDEEALGGYTNQILRQIKTASAAYTSQLGQLAVRQAYSGRGIVTGVSIASALSILLIIFTPLFIRQTIRKLSVTQARLKKSYKQLSEEKSRAEAILVSIGDGIFAVDTNNTITIFNQAAEEVSGMKKADMLGKKYADVLHFTSENAEGTPLDFIHKALHDVKSEVTHNAVLRHKSGRKIDVQITAAPVKDRRGTVVGAIIVFRDRTDEQALENAKDEFVSLASHQLRTPATVTKQFLAMFLEGYAGKIDDRQRVFLQQAYDNNELGINIIEELLNIARLETNKTKIKKEKLDLTEFLKKIADQHREIAQKDKQTITLELPQEPVFAQADPNLLSMLLDNLVSNALKYSFEGNEVVIKLTKSTHVTIEVSDSGIGIKPEHMAKIFERFGRLEDPQKQNVSGTGIGLYLVQKIVDMHHAKIRVKSEYGKGTTFILEFNENRE